MHGALAAFVPLASVRFCTCAAACGVRKHAPLGVFSDMCARLPTLGARSVENPSRLTVRFGFTNPVTLYGSPLQSEQGFAQCVNIYAVVRKTLRTSDFRGRWALPHLRVRCQGGVRRVQNPSFVNPTYTHTPVQRPTHTHTCTHPTTPPRVASTRRTCKASPRVTRGTGLPPTENGARPLGPMYTYILLH